MKILFLTLANIDDVNERNIYSDLMRKFRDEGHEVFIVTPTERRLKKKTAIYKSEDITLLKVKIPNIQKTNVLEKGISTLLIEHLFLAAIKKYTLGVRFDLVLYSTPPITFTKVIRYIKNRDRALSYLLLKDIFPQNAVDLGMLKKGGLIHRYFRYKEKQLYKFSDIIGCMSPANVEYIVRHNSELNPNSIEVNPNSIEPVNNLSSIKDTLAIRKLYNIPLLSTVFIYGGNLGKPQGIKFLLEVLDSNKKRPNIFFVIVGSGTEFSKVKKWFSINKPENAILLAGLPKTDYDQLIQACDVGLIFLDPRFTIPNFPSRLLSYLEYKMPVIAATDVNTDIGKIIEENKFGYWVKSGDNLKFNIVLELLLDKELLKSLGRNGHNYLVNNYTTFTSYSKIVEKIIIQNKLPK